jgi:HSP20 family molecular chaperone IbpA
MHGGRREGRPRDPGRGQRAHRHGPPPQRGIHGTWLVKERADGDSEASYAVDDTIDAQKIEAVLDGGVLTVTLT